MTVITEVFDKHAEQTGNTRPRGYLGSIAEAVRIKPLSAEFQYVAGSTPQNQREIVWLQLFTILWMVAEAAVATFAAIRARSVALLAFGVDSMIELASASFVLLRFKKIFRINETIASRATGLLLFALAAFILGSSVVVLVSPRLRPEPSYPGVALLLAAALVMPWLAHRKKILAEKNRSASLKADAVQSSMCAYLAWIALGGLLLNALFGFSWADPAAALGLLPIVIREGLEAIEGKDCVDCAPWLDH